jgi:large subunit ribosomal protein L21
MDYAIVLDGGKQFKAVVGQTIDVDRYEIEIGEEVDLNEVLLVRNGETTSVGTPLVEGAVVRATVVGQVKGPKLIVFQYTPKERIRTKAGHRQKYTRLRIDAIEMK